MHGEIKGSLLLIDPILQAGSKTAAIPEQQAYRIRPQSFHLVGWLSRLTLSCSPRRLAQWESPGQIPAS